MIISSFTFVFLQFTWSSPSATFLLDYLYMMHLPSNRFAVVQSVHPQRLTVHFVVDWSILQTKTQVATSDLSCYTWSKWWWGRTGRQEPRGIREGSQIRELGKKSWETGVLKWQEAGEITWQYLIFVGSKRSKGRKPQKRVEAGKAKHDGRWEIWTPPPPTHTHTHTDVKRLV